MSQLAKDNNTMSASWQLYDAERMANESLRQQLAESEAERLEQARLLGMSGEREAKLLTQLTAAQASEQRLLKRVSSTNVLLEAVCAIHPDSACAKYELAENMKAIALPQDTAALEAMIAKAGEVMREQCAALCDRFADREMHPAECAGAIRALPSVTLKDLK